MGTAQMRSQLHQYIDNIDDRFLNAMFAMVQQYVENDEIIGSTASGTPITKQELIDSVKIASEATKRGEKTALNDVIKMAEQW